MAQTAEIGALRVNLAMNAAEFNKGTEQAGDSLADLGKQFGFAASAAKVAAAAIAAAFVLVANAIAEGVRKALDDAAELEELSVRFKVPIETLAALASEGKIGVDKLSEGLTSLQTRLMEVASGDTMGIAARSFRAIGVEALNADGSVRAVADVLGEISDKFLLYEDGVEKSTLATTFFSKAGNEFVEVINDGADGMDELVAAAKLAGRTLDTDLGEAAKRVKENIEKLTPSFDQFYQKLAVQILPLLDKVLQSFVDTTDKINIMDGVVRGLAEAFKLLVSTGIIVKGAITAIGDAVGNVAGVLKKFIEGEYSQAWDLAVKGNEEANRNIADTIRGVQEVWGGWVTTMETNAAEHEAKVAAPIVASIKAISEAQKEWNKLVAEGEALGKKALTPYETQERQLKALDAAFAEHKISAEVLGRAQFQSAMVAQNAYASMASNIAGSLETVFGHSKAIAIASALINTYEGVTKALATYPPPFSYIAAAASLAAGLAQVANIRKTSKTSGGGGASVSAAPEPVQAGVGVQQSLLVQGINPGDIFTGDVVKGLAVRLLDFQRDGGKVVLQ